MSHLTPTALCRARGAPRTINRSGSEIVWSYGCGDRVVFSGQVGRFRPSGTIAGLLCHNAFRPAADIDVKPPAGLRKARRAQFVSGRHVAADLGCLACHAIGAHGNRGPGSNLSTIGTRLSTAELRDVVVSAPGDMPSFSTAPKRALDDLVFFLSRLRGARD